MTTTNPYILGLHLGRDLLAAGQPRPQLLDSAAGRDSSLLELPALLRGVRDAYDAADADR
jgi:hypothetical protein